jgi:hypothetical protein
VRSEFHPESIRFTSDRIGFEGFRALVRELPDQGEAGSGWGGRACFMLACRPGREKGHTSLCFEGGGFTLTMGRISSIIPPGEPYVIHWQRTAGRIGTFEIHPGFFEETLRRAGLDAARFRAVPPAALCHQPGGGLALPVAPGGNRAGRPRRAGLLRAPRCGAAAAHPASRCPDTIGCPGFSVVPLCRGRAAMEVCWVFN